MMGIIILREIMLEGPDGQRGFSGLVKPSTLPKKADTHELRKILLLDSEGSQ